VAPALSERARASNSTVAFWAGIQLQYQVHIYRTESAAVAKVEVEAALQAAGQSSTSATAAARNGYQKTTVFGSNFCTNRKLNRKCGSKVKAIAAPATP
jgi:hypothetical protein